jgi:hypothetical protein
MADDAPPNRYIFTILEIDDKSWSDLREQERVELPADNVSLRIRLEPVGHTTNEAVAGEFEITVSEYKEIEAESRPEAFKRYSNLYGAGGLGGCLGEVTIPPSLLEKLRRRGPVGA